MLVARAKSEPKKVLSKNWHGHYGDCLDVFWACLGLFCGCAGCSVLLLQVICLSKAKSESKKDLFRQHFDHPGALMRNPMPGVFQFLQKCARICNHCNLESKTLLANIICTPEHVLFHLCSLRFSTSQLVRCRDCCLLQFASPRGRGARNIHRALDCSA